MSKQIVQWKVHTPNLLKEVLMNEGASALHIPINILAELLEAVAKRASELNDPELNMLMLRLTLYSMADPQLPDYDPKLVNRLLSENELARQAKELIKNG